MNIPETRGRHTVYGFDLLKVGGHKDLGEYDRKKMRSVRSAATQYGKRNDKKFVVRQVKNNLIIWRTE